MPTGDRGHALHKEQEARREKGQGTGQARPRAQLKDCRM
jgi:hypothetical protein